MMNRSSSNHWLVFALMIGALAIGATAALFDTQVTIAVLISLIGALAIFWDYRIGVVAAMCLAPISSDNNLLKAFSVVVLLSFLSFAATRSAGRRVQVSLPRVFVLLYCLPFVAAFVAALMQIDIPYQAIKNPISREHFTLYGYSAAHLFPAISYCLLIILIGNAISESNDGEHWLMVYCLTAAIAGLTFLISLLTSGHEITVLRINRGIDVFFAHPNDWGASLGTAAGTLLFLSVLGNGRLRMFGAISLIIVLVALALTFSRGGYLIFIVSVLGLLIVHRQVKIIFGLVSIALISSLFLPEEVIDRATLGMDLNTLMAVGSGSMTDELTAGRGGILVRIAPEILESPIVGRGLGAMAWSDAFVSGRLNFTNPHNLYIEILLDTGFVGLALFAVWACKFLMICWQRSIDRSVPRSFSIFFEGLVFAFIGFLAMGLSNGHWYPRYEQSFLWIGLGILLAFWQTPAGQSVETALSSAGRSGMRARPSAAVLDH